MSAFTTALEQGIAVVTLDVAGAPVNTLSRAVGDEFAALLDRLAADPVVRGIVLLSGKPDSFIAGADIEEFTRLRTAEEATALSRWGQALIGRVEALPKPVVAAIHGTCLGGGLELALGCHWRVATDHPRTQLGLPEVQLGLLPGAGGCNRLPRLIGARAALDIILAGKSERAPKAKRLGMIDELVHPAILRETALRAADRLAREGVPARHRKAGAAGALLDGTAVGRHLVYRGARQQVLKKTGGRYPAPLAALETVRTSLDRGMEAGLALEARRFGELAVSDVSRKLVGIFFATTALKKDDGVPSGSVGEVPPVTRVGVVGSGFMGSGIAGTAVLQAEVEVRLRDAELGRVGTGLKAAGAILDERLTRRRLTRPQHQRLAALLSGGDGYHGFARADLVIEAVFEELAVKRGVLAELEAVVRDDTVLATNTSTIPIGEIAAMARRPGRILGMHFFSPVEKMPLLEVIPHAGTEPRAVATAVRFGRRMGKTVIVVADRPGFWVNRILTPYLNEAGRLLLEGVPIDLIDRTMTSYGFPVGPVALLDEVGLDVAQKAAGVMQRAFGDRLAPADVVGRMTADGRLGRKSGRGFHRYEDGRKGGVDDDVYRLLGVKPRPDVAAEVVERRLVYAMLNEAAMAAGEGVVRSARDGDIGAIFGIGFPPFRGGPLTVIDDLGPERVVATLRDLSAAFGDRFAPAPSLVRLAEAGGRFHHRGA
ncbi:MAG: fatty acid oxidation complex subunit alpha FadJ [Gemmatimonadales bacterium]|jgi:3-hydroxyacyl-CoA dehydrogenase/enoyl-CoA hydratase/3-hydroxybutyryl-CoA epimerase|nr:fatty acid oxidation complex subunit alpha FadJ [Gemmatimonadales bacterium]